MLRNKALLAVIVVVAIVAAVAIGVAIGRQSVDAPGADAGATAVPPAQLASAAAVEPVSQRATEHTGIFINERELSADQVRQLVVIYRHPPPPGHFWYDSRSGLYGAWGHEAAGYIRPGHDFGPLQGNASAGNTGVCSSMAASSMPSKWRSCRFSSTGRCSGAALQQAQRQLQGTSQWGWRDGTGAAMASDGNCTMMAVPGAPVYSAGGC